PPTSTPFPYTTLFRSRTTHGVVGLDVQTGHLARKGSDKVGTPRSREGLALNFLRRVNQFIPVPFNTQGGNDDFAERLRIGLQRNIDDVAVGRCGLVCVS